MCANTRANPMGKAHRYKFAYYKDGEGEDRSIFYQLPKILLEDPRFRDLSLNAKVIYCVLLDRMHLSIKNKKKYSDEFGRIFILFKVEDVSDILNISKRTVLRAYKELDDKTGIGLIHRERAPGMQNIVRLYVKDVTTTLDLSLIHI